MSGRVQTLRYKSGYCSSFGGFGERNILIGEVSIYERYLRTFLEDGDDPIDNNASKYTCNLRFMYWKKRWEIIDTVSGATNSALIYCIAETAKANGLKPFNYNICSMRFQKHVDEKNDAHCK